MFRRLQTIPVEIAFVSFMMLILLALSVRFGLPIRLPAPGLLASLGVLYLLPMAGAMLCAISAWKDGNSRAVGDMTISLACYLIVILIYFNLKLWTPFVNNAEYDSLFWKTDQNMRPIIDLCMFIRRFIKPLLPYDSGFYLAGFIVMFYISFIYHAIHTMDAFMTLIRSAIFLQGFGALGYLFTPTLGPFLFEPAVNPRETAAQQVMLTIRHLSIAHGPQWLSTQAAPNFMTGLGAMPSLHAGFAFLFLWFAWRHARILLPTYIPLFAFILVAAIANRWHYVIDIPVGIALSAFSIHLATRFGKRDQPQPAAPLDTTLLPDAA